MSQIVSLVINNADKLPIVGSPIVWYRKRSHSQETEPETPPPPYEHSKLTQLSDFVWKRASFSNNSHSSSTAPITNAATNKTQMDEGISLIQMATQMNQAAVDKNSQQISVNLYMLGLDKIFSSLPIESNPLLKSSLESKLVEIKKKCGLILLNDDPDQKKKLTEEEKNQALGGLSNLIIQFAILFAITLKKSPIPGIMSRLVDFTKASIIKIDQTCSISQRTMNITQFGIQKAIEMDQHYEVHQFFAEIFYTLCTAFLKASVAYSEEKPKEE